MMDILSQVYGQHNLTGSLEKLSEQIELNQVKPWIKFDPISREPLACAALIDHGNFVEIGRAANHPLNGGNGGGKLMELACNWHTENDNRSLIAEIRMAKDFQGITGGQGSQHVLINKLNFIPHAFIPTFHHPGPSGIDRQELFCFATLLTNIISKRSFQISFPGSVVELFGKEITTLLSHQGILNPEIKTNGTSIEKAEFEIKDNAVFHEITTVENGISLSEVKQQLQNDSQFRFAQVRIQPKSENFSLLNELNSQGATFMGFDFDNQGIPNSLWGWISNNIQFAPTLCATSLNPTIQSFAHKVDTSLRERSI